MLTYDPNVGFLFNGQPVNLHGSVGRNVLDASTAAAGALDASRFDPRYYESYTFNNGDAGEQAGYRLRPEYAERLGGRTQLRNQSVGGYGEVVDPSHVTYDEEFGLLTDPRNIRDPATPRDNMIGNLAMAAFAAPIAYGIALNSGLLGAASGIGGTNLGAYGGMTTGLDGITGTLAGEAALGAGGGAIATIPEGLLQNITIPPLDIANPTLASIEGLGGTAPWYSTLLQNAQANLSNPMTVARGLLGAANLANNLSGSNSSGTPGLIDGGVGVGNAPRLNFSQLSSYTPMQFDPVPFMSGRYGG